MGNELFKKAAIKSFAGFAHDAWPTCKSIFSRNPIFFPTLTISCISRRWSFPSLADLGGRAALPDIYNSVGKHTRAASAEAAGTDWQATVREKLQEGVIQEGRGVWSLPAC